MESAEAASPDPVVSATELAAAVAPAAAEEEEDMKEEGKENGHERQAEEKGAAEEERKTEEEQPGGSEAHPEQQSPMHEERPAELPIEEPEDEEMDDEEEVLLEPMFNYKEIIGSDVTRMFARESATAIFAHDKFIAIGTNAGNVWIMDQTGHIDQDSAPVYRAHRVSVSRLAVDSTGSYIMSAANDGKVVIKGILCDELNYTLTVPEVARSIALTAEFARPASGNVFVVGDRNLTVHSKGFFGYGEKVVYRGSERDGYITRASCQGPFVAFTNEQGTRIFDRSVERVLSVVSPKHDVDRLRSNRHPPHHCWLDHFTLAVGWADTVIIAAITTQDEGGVRRRRVKIHYSWTVELLISGISFTVRDNKWEEIVLIGLKVDSEGGMNGDFLDTISLVSSAPSLLSSPVSPPSSTAGGELAPILQLLILSPVALNEYELQAEDRISLRLSARTTAAQVHLGALPYDGLYFLLAPKFFLYAEPFQPDNKISWRLENGLVEEAWELACRSPESEKKSEVGRKMIEKLIEEDRCKYATSRLKEVCGESKQEWEYFVGVWEAHRMVCLLAECMPTTKPQLEPECYEAVLLSALYNDIPLFRKLVQMWNPDLYRVGSITDRTLARLQEATVSNTETMVSQEEEKSLYLALAHLYNYERKYDSSLKIYLALKDKQIFSVVDKYSLFGMVKDQISDLMAIDSDLALRLLLDNEDAVSPATVMTKTARQPRLQMLYLGKLFSRHEGDQFADTAVKLYAEHDRKALLPFLKSSEKYNISRALQICKEKALVEERIFLLGKSGNRIEALNLIISQFNRIDLAISFCQEHDDRDLWTYLVDEIVKRPQHMKQLLSTAGPSLDPLFVVQRMPADLVVPGLRDALAKILRDYAMQVELQRGCHDATLADVRVLMTSMLGFANAAIGVSPRTRCVLCDKLIVGRGGVEGELKLFACHHTLHVACATQFDRLEESERRGSSVVPFDQLACPICSDDTH
ncbi:hypothetical protein PMAYCL1PPCAC_03265 [Pristionchus mayeri]|uniref:RING-type domain-containing protein n=1 Tax=Pristionchus mayeri TaxID=1317129 RepID=A0AAN4Z8E7_9BILA|nr:hypothetical protein PMAYCL1PPCAC_03265 [Pristionchus mayeri]